MMTNWSPRWLRAPMKKVKTNQDRIREMTADELADVLNRVTDYCPVAKDGKVYCAETDCKPCIVKWLESEVVDEG